MKRNYTEKGNVCEGEELASSVDWNEEFRSLCSILRGSKEDLIPPWKVSLTLLQKVSHRNPSSLFSDFDALFSF